MVFVFLVIYSESNEELNPYLELCNAQRNPIFDVQLKLHWDLDGGYPRLESAILVEKVTVELVFCYTVCIFPLFPGRLVKIQQKGTPLGTTVILIGAIGPNQDIINISQLG